VPQRIIASIVTKMVDLTQVANAWVGMDRIPCNGSSNIVGKAS
jgi:hypothetical protein